MATENTGPRRGRPFPSNFQAPKGRPDGVDDTLREDSFGPIEDQAPRRTADDARDQGMGSRLGDSQRSDGPRDNMGSRDAEEVLTRQSRFDVQGREFDIPEEYKKPGWDYEWKAVSVLGQGVSGGDFAHWHRQGWRAENPLDWPTLVPPGYKGETVDDRGQRLFGRPMTLSMEAKQEDHQAATQQQYDRMKAASEGAAGREAIDGIRGIIPRRLGVEVYAETGSRPPVLKR